MYNQQRAFRRKQMANYEVNCMIARYEHECKDFPPRLETEEEKKERLLRDERKRRADERKKVIK